MAQIEIGEHIQRDLEEGWLEAKKLAFGDSNDDEIEAWRELAEEAMRWLGVKEPAEPDLP